MFKKIGFFLLAFILLLIAYFALTPSPIDPVAWTPPKAPELTGPYQKNDKLAALEVLFPGQCNKCEDVAIDATGKI